MIRHPDRRPLILGLASVCAALLLWTALPVQTAPYAQALVETCTAREGARDVCYETEVAALFGELSVPELFEVIRDVRSADPEYQFCHVLAHKIGEYAVAEDPDRWLSLIPLNPTDGVCSNGFIHGVIVGRFRDDALDDETLKATIPDFSRACEPQEGWDPTPLDQAICYHGMGHLFMFITDADYRRALDACAAIEQSPTGNYGRVCREGVFMQTYQPLEPDDFDLIALLPEAPTRENYRRICAKFDRDAEEAACLREAWILFRQEILDGSGIAPFCSGHPAAEIDACYQTIFAVIGRMSQSASDRTQIARACAAAPTEKQGECYGAVAVAFIEENRRAIDAAVSVCRDATPAAQSGCFRILADRVNFVYGNDSSGKDALCSALPSVYEIACRDVMR